MIFLDRRCFRDLQNEDSSPNVKTVEEGLNTDDEDDTTTVGTEKSDPDEAI